MSDLFKSDNYDKNFNSLIRVIKLKDTKKINEQYDETLKDLSQALKNSTNNAKDVAKFVIYSDLNNYVEPLNAQPLGFVETLKRILDRVLGKDIPTKDNDIKNFVGDELSGFTIEKAAEYTIILKGINELGYEKLNTLKEFLDSKQSKKKQEEYKPHQVSSKNKTISKQKEDTPKLQEGKQPVGKLVMKRIKRPTTAPPPPPTVPNELKPEPQEKASTTEKKKVHFKSKPEIIPFSDSGYASLSDEESDEKIPNYQEKGSIYAAVPKEHIKKTKRVSKQQQQSKPPIPLKPSIAPRVPNANNQEARQKPKKGKPKILPKPKNLGSADQQVSTKPRIVGVTSQKLAESKPIIPLKKSADKAASEVKAVAMKEKVNSKKDGRVKSMVEKFEQNQVANTNSRYTSNE
ncbi:hypothetical protein [Wolbachia endosymbiont (group B) of Gerris lacustris]|uniref:hypothetical protein n=1 Tax=Wolbachia endosymbiont (group B) of Gerris lacustris TaxID=3066159 RepID=UPI00333F4641